MALGQSAGQLAADLLETRSGEVVRGHADPELHAGIEANEEGLRQPGYAGRVRYVDQHPCAARPVLLREVGGGWLDVIQGGLECLADRPVLEKRVERLVRDF